MPKYSILMRIDNFYYHHTVNAANGEEALDKVEKRHTADFPHEHFTLLEIREVEE